MQAFDFLVAVTGQPDLDFVFPVLWKGIWNQYPTASPDWQLFNMFLLSEVRTNSDGFASWRAAERSNCDSTDFLRCQNVAFQQHRREVTGPCIVKAVTNIFLWQQLRGVDVHCQEVPNSVLIFGAAEPPECFRSAWVLTIGRRLVQRVGQPRHHRAVSTFLRTVHSRRRHLSRS